MHRPALQPGLGSPTLSLAERVPGVDLIISAGPGDLLTKPWQAPGKAPSSAREVARQHPGELLAEVYLQLDSAGTVTQCFGAQTVLTPQMKNAPEITGLVREYRAQ